MQAQATQIAEFLTKGFSVIFFPATTTDGKGLPHPRYPAIAIDADVPIRPILIAYVDKDGVAHEYVIRARLP